jgi:hypothetical protein
MLFAALHESGFGIFGRASRANQCPVSRGLCCKSRREEAVELDFETNESVRVRS